MYSCISHRGSRCCDLYRLSVVLKKGNNTPAGHSHKTSWVSVNLPFLVSSLKNSPGLKDHQKIPPSSLSPLHCWSCNEEKNRYQGTHPQSLKVVWSVHLTVGNIKPNPIERVALYSTYNNLEDVSLLVSLLFQKNLSLMTQPRASGDIFPLLIYLDHYTQVAPHLSTTQKLLMASWH